MCSAASGCNRRAPAGVGKPCEDNAVHDQVHRHQHARNQRPRQHLREPSNKAPALLHSKFRDSRTFSAACPSAPSSLPICACAFCRVRQREPDRSSVKINVKSASRRPGLVVAGGLGPAAADKRRARRTVGRGRAGQVRLMRLFPLARRVALFGRRHIDCVMQPAMP